MEHTPGPWIVLYKKKYNEWHVSVPAENSNLMRIFLFPDGVPGDTNEEMEANARLIAAAPDLLEACEEALRDLEKLHEYSFPIFCEGKCKTCRQTIPTLRSAIAKAKEQEDA